MFAAMTSAHEVEPSSADAAPREAPVEADRILTPVQARTRAGVSHRTFQRYRAAGLITPAHVLPNGHARFRASDVDAMLARFAEETADADDTAAVTG